MGVKMIWPHDRTGLSLINADLSQKNRTRGTARKKTLTSQGLWGTSLNQSELWRKTVGGRTGQQERGQKGGRPLRWSQGWKSLSQGFNGSQNSSTDQNLWTIEKREICDSNGISGGSTMRYAVGKTQKCKKHTLSHSLKYKLNMSSCLLHTFFSTSHLHDIIQKQKTCWDFPHFALNKERKINAFWSSQ